MYKQDLALNNLQWLIYHKTQSSQTELTFFGAAVQHFSHHTIGPPPFATTDCI